MRHEECVAVKVYFPANVYDLVERFAAEWRTSISEAVVILVSLSAQGSLEGVKFARVAYKRRSL
ncbi:MAG: hypothetical protein NZ920_01325 [Aigarchaeota archaeon]|nr:hypothetical protein [Aigarchaeota archaeon]MDW8093083.1 hypothetical protein [Nitrososphaerota archaeon]